MSINFFESDLLLDVVIDDGTPDVECYSLSSDDRPIPKPAQGLTPFEQILRDPSLARQMHTPDYFMLVE